mgnify:CR=1 FL=1
MVCLGAGHDVAKFSILLNVVSIQALGQFGFRMVQPGSVRITLTPKARTTCEKLKARLARIDEMIQAKGALPAGPNLVHDTLRSYERSWDDYLRFGTV